MQNWNFICNTNAYPFLVRYKSNEISSNDRELEIIMELGMLQSSNHHILIVLHMLFYLQKQSSKVNALKEYKIPHSNYTLNKLIRGNQLSNIECHINLVWIRFVTGHTVEVKASWDKNNARKESERNK